MLNERGQRGRNLASNWTAANVRARKRTVRASLCGDIQDAIRSNKLCHCARVAIQQRQRGKADRRASRPYRRRASLDGFGGVGIVGVVGLVALGQWWNPVSWGEWLFGQVGQTFDDVKRVIHDAVKWVADELDAALDLVDYVFTIVTNALTASLNIAWQVLNGLWSWVENAFATVESWITSAVTWWWDNIILPTIGFVRDALNWAVDVLQYAINLVQGALDWAINNLIVPMLHWIESAAETVGHWIWDAIDWFYQQVIAPIVHDVEAIFAEVWQIADFVWHGLLDVYHAFVKAWQWIVWFGEHTFDDIKALLFETDHALTRDWLLGAAHDPGGWSSRLADDLARILE